MVPRIHQVEQLKSNIPGIEAMTLVSSHHFPRHSHDQFGIGVIAFGAQRSWSGVGSVQALAGDVIMSNPGETHDGAPLDGDVRGWRMLYLDPALLAREAQSLFDHPAAQAQFGATVFWFRRLACLEGEQAAVEYWQVKRGGGSRGIIEITGEKA